MKSLRGLVLFFSGFRVRGLAGSMRSQGLGFKVAFWVEAPFRIQGLELRALGLRVWVAGFRVSLDARQPTCLRLLIIEPYISPSKAWLSRAV